VVGTGAGVLFPVTRVGNLICKDFYRRKLTNISHNDALAESFRVAMADFESLECQLSGYCTALRIRFYLWRMTRPNTMCRLRKYKPQVKAECFICYYKQLSSLATQEFSRFQDPASGRFNNVRRGLVGKPIEVNAIAIPLTDTSDQFCTICQDDHLALDCVSSLNCSCVFGRDCLQPLLNFDTPSSYACPNCRTRLHEPLKWRPIEISSERDAAVGLLWALRSNIACLQREINADPDPFTPRQRIEGFLGRLVFGR
jgi:hypothetical protein